MKTINICELDQSINKEPVSLDIAMRKVTKYIQKSIDPTFPQDGFKAWYSSGSEKGFRWNKINYIWENK